METRHGYWIHKRIASENTPSGYVFSRECICSVCGKESSFEKEICPFCGAVMDQDAPADAFIEEKKEEKKPEPEPEPARDPNIIAFDQIDVSSLSEEDREILKQFLTSYQDVPKEEK